jgi:hypothetical protein
MPIDFPSNPTNGQVYGNYIYDSSITAWRNVNTDTGIGTLNAMGLKNVVPTSVVVGSGSATTNSLGTVTFSGVSKVILNNVFTSVYSNYKAVLNLTSTTDGADLWFRFASGGTENTNTSYRRQGLRVANTTLTNWTSTPEAYFYFCPTGNQVPAAEVTFFSPQANRETKMLSHAFSFLSGTFQYTSTGGWFDTTTQFDGVSLGISSGTMSGTLSIYGLTN